MPTGCNVGHLNARSVKNKIEEVTSLLHNFDIDILALTETWLNQSIEDVNINIDNYNLTRLDRQSESRNSRGGGLMIYAKSKYTLNSTKYSHLNLSNQNIEAQIVELTKINFKTIVLINIYRPPSGTQQDFLMEVTNLLEALGGLRYPDIYIVGDFNIDHTPSKQNDCTKSLISMLQSYGLSQHIKVPTRRTSTTSTILDVMYVKTEKIIHPYIIKTAVSDHFLTGCVRYLDYVKPDKATVRGRSYRKYNKEKAEAYYHRFNTSQIYNMNSAELIWEYLNKLITNCANVLCPYRDITVRTDKPTWLTDEIIELLGDRDRAFEEAFETKNDTTLAEAKKLRTQSKQALRNARAQFIKSNLDNNKNNPKKNVV